MRERKLRDIESGEYKKAIKKLGEEIGVEMDHNLGARALDAINRTPVRKKD